MSDLAATGSTIDAVALSVQHGAIAVGLSGGATIIAGSNGSASLTLSGTLPQLNAALAALVYTAPTTGAVDTLAAVATDGIASSAPLTTTITLTNIATTVSTTEMSGVFAAGTAIPITVTFGEAVAVTDSRSWR